MGAYSLGLSRGVGLLCCAVITTGEIAICCPGAGFSVLAGVCAVGNVKRCCSMCMCSARCFPYSLAVVLQIGWWPPSLEGLSVIGQGVWGRGGTARVTRGQVGCREVDVKASGRKPCRPHHSALDQKQNG